MSRVRGAVVIVVTVIWAVTWLAAIYTNDYQGLGAVTPLMVLVVGVLLGRNGRNGARPA